jgi:hypothetical protein
MIAKCLNCNQDYDQETQGAICPHAVGGPNKGDPWPTLKQPFQETWARYERWCKAKGRHATHGDLWKGFLEGSRAFDEHLGHVGQFLSDMYATMIDPCEQSKMKVAEMCELLLKTAREHRETAHKVEDAFTKIGNYCAAHDDVIDASWVAKVIDGTRESR